MNTYYFHNRSSDEYFVIADTSLFDAWRKIHPEERDYCRVINKAEYSDAVTGKPWHLPQ